MEIKNPTNIQIAQELCKQSPDSSYAKLLGYNTETGELAVKDLSIFTSTPDIANEFISDMANKIVVQRTYDLFRGYEMPFKVFMRSMSRLGDVEELLTSELAQAQDYDGSNTNPFNAPKPTIKLSWLKTEDKKYTAVRLSYEIWAGAFEEYLRVAITQDLTGEKITTTETITAIDGAGDTANSQKAYEEILKLVSDMAIPSTKYNNSGVKTFTPKGRAVLILNTRYSSSFDVNVLASLFNSGEIAIKKYFSAVITTELDDENCVGIVIDEEGYLWGSRFDVAQSINNPATLEINTYYHRWVKRAVVPFRQAVRLVTE